MYSFFPSDYLVIRTDPEILQLTFDSEEPVDYYQILERKIAKFFGAENVLFFPDGYLALVALLRNLIQPDDRIFIPSEADGAIIDVLEIVQRHCETVQVEVLSENCFKKLPSSTSRVVILASGVSESACRVAPVDVWTAQLNELFVQRGIPGLIILDDSIGVGMLGRNHRGTYDTFGISANHFPDPLTGVQHFFSGSLTETFGSSGGFLVGDRKWLKIIRRTDPCCCLRSQIPLSNVVAAQKAFELASDPERHKKLHRNKQLLWQTLKKYQINFISDPNLPFVLVKAAAPREVIKGMGARGCRISMTHFTRKTLLCLAVNAAHQEMEIEFLVQTLAELLNLREESKKSTKATAKAEKKEEKEKYGEKEKHNEKQGAESASLKENLDSES